MPRIVNEMDIYCKNCGGSGTSGEQYYNEYDSEGMICGECGGTGEASDE